MQKPINQVLNQSHLISFKLKVKILFHVFRSFSPTHRESKATLSVKEQKLGSMNVPPLIMHFN